MNRDKMKSLALLLLLIPAFIICGGMFLLLAYTGDMSFEMAVPMFALFMIYCGFLWMLPFLVKKFNRRSKPISFDERDQMIHKKSAMIGYIVLWVYFVAACAVAWFVAGPEGTISVYILPAIIIGGLIIFTSAQIISGMILESDHWKDDSIEGEIL